ncbi:MAG: hypothetical protein HFJ55_03425 [Clostridia bacterium]|nr:hypothetical protein [Clostridia bacterium]
MERAKHIKKLIIAIMIIFVSTYANISYAALKNITDENLKTSLQKMAKTEYNNGKYEILVENNIITIKNSDESYNINYNLTGSPTFTVEIPIEKGMSYEEFMNETDKTILPVMGYVAISDMQGIKLEDTMAYIMFSYLENRLSGAISNKSSYEIVDDLKEGSEVEKKEDPKIIYTSEFGEKVLEYSKDLYKEKQTMSDRTGFNTYEMTIELEEVTEDSSKIVSKLSVKSEADFSKLDGYSKDSSGNTPGDTTGGTGEETPGGVNGGNGQTMQPVNQGQKTEKPGSDNTVANTILPKTGSVSLIIIIAIILVIAIMLHINNKRYKDIK